MSKDLKLLIILNDLPFFISHRLHLAVEAKKRGFDVHILAPYHKKSYLTVNKYGLKFHDIPLKRGGKNIFSELKLFISIWKQISKTKPHLVHFVSMKPVLYGGIIARILKVPGTVNAITGLGFLFWNLGSLKVTNDKLAVMNNLIIPIAILNSYFIFGEQIDSSTFVPGMICFYFALKAL